MKTNKKGLSTQKRQGDLLFQRLDGEWNASSRQGKLRPSRDNIIAKGEATGHNHEMVCTEDSLAQLFFSEGGVPVVVVEEGEVNVTHQEHDTQVLGEGTWVVVRQEEYTPGNRWRTVRD